MFSERHIVVGWFGDGTLNLGVWNLWRRRGQPGAVVTLQALVLLQAGFASGVVRQTMDSNASVANQYGQKSAFRGGAPNLEACVPVQLEAPHNRRPIGNRD